METDIETFIDETDAIINTTEEEPITEQPTTEEEPETNESPADESAAQEMAEPDLVFTYELEQERDYFIMNHLWAGEDHNRFIGRAVKPFL